MIFFKTWLKTCLPREGEKNYKSLRDYTNEELIYCLDNNLSTDLFKLSGVMSEILRRMNERSPLLNENNTKKT